jgi:hypothetical protein
MADPDAHQPPALFVRPAALQEHAAHRAIAVKWCKGCPVLELCSQAAEERGERFGVWGGVDRATRPGRKTHSTNQMRTKQQRN